MEAKTRDALFRELYQLREENGLLSTRLKRALARCVQLEEKLATAHRQRIEATEELTAARRHLSALGVQKKSTGANVSEIDELRIEQAKGAERDKLGRERDRLRDALELAVSHIGWCWDKIEEFSQMRREGSDDIHRHLRAVLDEVRPRD